MSNFDVLEKEYVVWKGASFEVPDIEVIEEWVYDSVCESLTGHIVEHDGYAPDGSPSWLLVLGLI